MNTKDELLPWQSREAGWQQKAAGATEYEGAKGREREKEREVDKEHPAGKKLSSLDLEYNHIRGKISMGNPRYIDTRVSRKKNLSKILHPFRSIPFHISVEKDGIRRTFYKKKSSFLL